VQANDVIFATVRPMLKRVAMIPDYLDGQIVSTAFCVLRANPTQANSWFIYYSLLTDEFMERVGNLQRGASYPAVTDGNVLGQEVLVPPLSEQRGIAGVLAKIQAAAEVQEKIVATLKEVKAATMAKLFREGLHGEPLKQTEIGEIPESWEVVRCETICETISVGIVVTPAKYYVPSGVPCFRSFNVQEDRLLEKDLVFISERANELHRKSKLRSGDVIVVRTGYPGTACVVPEKYEGANCVDLIIARPNRQVVLSDYLARYMNSPEGRRHVLLAQGGLAQQHFNVSALKRMTIALPSTDEQADISQIGRALDSKIAAAEDKLSCIRSLFSSMLHLLMTGEVRLPGFRREPNLDSPWFKPEDVWEFVGRLVQKFNTERVILFGSRAWGTPTRDSDVDLLVVMEFEGRPVDMAVRIGAECDDRFPMDLIVRRPAEVQRRIAMGDPFFNQILRDGLVLHERAA
jgi:type I restriction enzyme S subunit